MRMPRLSAVILFGLLVGVVEAAIPIDYFDDLTFEAPVESRLRVAGRLDDRDRCLRRWRPGSSHHPAGPFPEASSDRWRRS
ncbi:MAG: hypothetical protein CME13_16155 [Gemmatimonadetes bacterium]|nr:hypothetical protein [Gemmatimonadota bacterium]HCV22175.1 hypothetical protein [Candidatus Latescibacterota bacterium]